MVCSLEAYAASDSATIGIGVSIKASSQCDYNYSLERHANISSYSRASTCDIHSFTLQQHLEQVAYTANIQSDEQRYRMFMTVE